MLKGNVKKVFKPVFDGETGEVDETKDPVFKGFQGHIECAGFAGDCAFRPAVKRSEKSPDFECLVKTKINGQEGWFEFGAVWWREAEAGGQYMSLKFDNEMLDKPTWLNVFPPVNDDEDEGDWNIVWQRPNRNAAPKKKVGTQPAAGVDDDILF